MAIALLLVAFAGCETVRGAGRVAAVRLRPARGRGRDQLQQDQVPDILRHVRRAVRDGWPRVLALRRSGADERRDALLDAYPTRDGFDRDEHPPAVGRRGRGGACGVRPELGKLVPRRHDGDQAAPVLRRHAVPVRLLLSRGLIHWGRGSRALSDVGGVQIGGGAPVVVQTTTKIKTANPAATMDQIRKVADAGADIVRVAVPRDKDIEALKTIVVESPIPAIADIHSTTRRRRRRSTWALTASA